VVVQNIVRFPTVPSSGFFLLDFIDSQIEKSLNKVVFSPDVQVCERVREGMVWFNDLASFRHFYIKIDVFEREL
jgi:hypothetical protein